MGIPLSGKDLPLVSAFLGPSDSSINISIAHHLAGVVRMNGSSICKWALLAGTVPRSVAAAWEPTWIYRPFIGKNLGLRLLKWGNWFLFATKDALFRVRLVTIATLSGEVAIRRVR